MATQGSWRHSAYGFARGGPARGKALHPLRQHNDLGSTAIASYDEDMDVTTVSPKFQVLIPKRVREQFGLSPG